jgi:hypothetical protein
MGPNHAHLATLMPDGDGSRRVVEKLEGDAGS